MDIRPALPADAAAVAALTRAAYALYVPRMGVQPAPMLADFSTDIADGLVWVARRGDETAGALTLRATDAWLLLDSIAVDPAHGGRGVGGALLAFAQARAAAQGVALRLYTHRTMVENQAWYRRHGFVEIAPFERSAYDRVYFERRA